MGAVIVVGGGVIGLTTAAELLERGHRVEVWTRDEVRDTTSAVAAAVWYPYLAEPRDRVLRWSHVTFERLSALARAGRAGVRLLPVVELFGSGAPDLWWLPAGVTPRDVDVDAFGGAHRRALEVAVPLCDTSVYLPWLRDTVVARGGAIVRREVATLDEAFGPAATVVNCTGLAARALCDDRELSAVRGQVVVVERLALPRGVIDDTDPDRPVYVLPRGDDVVLGGTAQHGDERVEADPADTEAILAACRRRLTSLGPARVRAVAVGLRPFRPRVRLEVESKGGGRRLIHSYGHGGSGFTLAWGCAAEVADLVGAVE